MSPSRFSSLETAILPAALRLPSSAWLLAVCIGLHPAAAQNSTSAELPEVVVTAESTSARFLPPVEGTRIFSGKKNSVFHPDELPKISNNNYRQALSKTPGLFLSEETTPLVSLGYRGLDPNRTQFTQVLKDGIPIHADQFGYPEAYYTPPFENVERMEFLHGGAALTYGPQPGGALNYVTRRPRTDREFSFGSSNTFGSDNFYSNYSYLDGTSGRVGYYGYFNHRAGDGFRDQNSAFNLNAGQIKLVLDGSTDSRWILNLEGYTQTHGEPGGLTFATGPNQVNYNANRDAASRRYDMFELKRYSGSLAWEKDFSAETKLSLTTWGTYYSRYTSRQRGGGFGTLPTGPAADTTGVELQEFYTQGFEARLRHDYELWGGTHTVAGGFQGYHTYSPREDRRGNSKNDRGGTIRTDTDREIWYLPVFVENRFHWGALSVTPGVRFENIWQSVKENKNADKTAAGTPLGDEKDQEFVPLFGLGISYEVARKVEFYTNASQSYRPKIYTQAVPNNVTALVPQNLEEGAAWQYEVGFRGSPRPWVSWDVSCFLLDFDNQIGNIALPGGFSTIANVGRAQHRGVEAATEIDLIGLLDALHGPSASAPMGKDSKAVAPLEKTLVERFGSLSLYGNVTLLDAEFVSGPLEGKTPRYASDYLVRTGVIYRWQDRFKIAFLGTFVGDSFADDANTPERAVPGYMVWDLSAEATIYKDIVSVNAGINNVFSEDYYARVRDEGIDPAYRRNFYGGLSLKF